MNSPPACPLLQGHATHIGGLFEIDHGSITAARTPPPAPLAHREHLAYETLVELRIQLITVNRLAGKLLTAVSRYDGYSRHLGAQATEDFFGLG